MLKIFSFFCRRRKLKYNQFWLVALKNDYKKTFAGTEGRQEMNPATAPLHYLFWIQILPGNDSSDESKILYEIVWLSGLF